MVGVGLATRWSRVRFPAAATRTEMGDRLQAGKPPQYFTKRPDQLSLLPAAGREQPKCGVALRLGSKRQVWLIPLVDKRVGGR